MTPPPCPLCRRAFARHLVVRAVSAARWRGPSFDAAQAKANVGLAVADALGVDARDKAALEAFTRDVVVDAYRAVGDANPAEAFEPRAEPEPWEFHVGLVRDADEATWEAVRGAAVRAVTRSRGYSEAALTG